MYKNSEGYPDPVMGAVLSKVMREEKQKYKRLVYICSPYAGDIEKNTELAKRYCKKAINKGYAPIAPHLFYPQFLEDNKIGEREIGIRCGLTLLKKSQEMWVFGNKYSSGMKREIDFAKRNGRIKIRYFDKEGRERDSTI